MGLIGSDWGQAGLDPGQTQKTKCRRGSGSERERKFATRLIILPSISEAFRSRIDLEKTVRPTGLTVDKIRGSGAQDLTRPSLVPVVAWRSAYSRTCSISPLTICLERSVERTGQTRLWHPRVLRPAGLIALLTYLKHSRHV